MREQRVDHVVGVGGLGEIIDRAELHRIHRGRDIAVAGQDDAARVRPALLQRGDDVEAVAVAEPHVDHREGGRDLLDLQQAVGDRFGGGHRRSRGLPSRARAAAGTTCRPRRSAASVRSGWHGRSIHVGTITVRVPLPPYLSVRGLRLKRSPDRERTLEIGASPANRHDRAAVAGTAGCRKSSVAPERSSSVLAMKKPSPRPVVSPPRTCAAAARLRT